MRDIRLISQVKIFINFIKAWPYNFSNCATVNNFKCVLVRKFNPMMCTNLPPHLLSSWDHQMYTLAVNSVSELEIQFKTFTLSMGNIWIFWFCLIFSLCRQDSKLKQRLKVWNVEKNILCSEKYFTAELIGDLNLNINTNWCNFSCHKFIHQFIYFYKHQFRCVWHMLSVQYAPSNIINDF